MPPSGPVSSWCRRSAAEVGPVCTQAIADFVEVNAIHRLRSAQGVLAFRKTGGDPRLEAACTRAIGVGDPSYRVRELLARPVAVRARLGRGGDPLGNRGVLGLSLQQKLFHR